MTFTSVQKAILTTLAYRAIFSYPLTYHQLYSYLVFDGDDVDKESFDEALQKLLEAKLIVQDKLFYALSDLSKSSRQEKQENSKRLHAKAVKISKLLGLIPSVMLIGITGAVAAGNARANDDIDVLIVTSGGKLWTTRFFVVLILKMLGLYRKDSNENAKICPNIFMDEKALLWQGDKSIYTAHEVFLLKPIFDRGDYYFKFLQENNWAADFVPNMKVSFNSRQNFPENKITGQNLIETFFMKLQLWYMKSKQTNEITMQKFIHFKKHDHKSTILEEFEKKLKELNLS